MPHQTNNCGCKIGRVTTTYEIPNVDTNLVDDGGAERVFVD